MKHAFILIIFIISGLNGRAILEPLPSDLGYTGELLYNASINTVVSMAQARANALYGTEFGFKGATNTIITADAGYQFVYVNILGDGNCGFYAAGITREGFVQAIESFVQNYHDDYWNFKWSVETLRGQLSTLIESQKDQLNNIADGIKKLMKQIGMSDTSENVADLMFVGRLKEVRAEIVAGESTFAEVKQTLLFLLDNLSYPVYEAFLIGLMGDLRVGEIFPTKDEVINGIRAVFERNRGRNSWFPGWILLMIKDKLATRVNIWGYGEDGKVTLLHGTGGDKPQVRHVFFTGGHYDMLIPLMPEF
jgi:hypothetical protein